mmetsp:Transcript_5337/g.7891  ORF Transcript_5337/g.7891 Transcript_5337/m.7891 type:complete len:333 (+) Transcript_5337:614-1612(+)
MMRCFPGKTRHDPSSGHPPFRGLWSGLGLRESGELKYTFPGASIVHEWKEVKLFDCLLVCPLRLLPITSLISVTSLACRLSYISLACRPQSIYRYYLYIRITVNISRFVRNCDSSRLSAFLERTFRFSIKMPSVSPLEIYSLYTALREARFRKLRLLLPSRRLCPAMPIAYPRAGAHHHCHKSQSHQGQNASHRRQYSVSAQKAVCWPLLGLAQRRHPSTHTRCCRPRHQKARGHPTTATDCDQRAHWHKRNANRPHSRWPAWHSPGPKSCRHRTWVWQKQTSLRSTLLHSPLSPFSFHLRPAEPWPAVALASASILSAVRSLCRQLLHFSP